ncbi:jg7295, partial [Pararge aegeria aegeria]
YSNLSNYEEYVVPCDPASDPRSRVPGPVSEKLVTKDCTGVGGQAPVPVNVPGSSNKKFVRQAFHPGLFPTRPRFSSVGISPTKKRKRKRKENSPNQNEKTSKFTKSNIQYTVPTHNQFDLLEDDKPDRNNKEQTYIPKPEPIFVTGVINVGPLKNLLNDIMDCNSYSMTTLRSGHIVKIITHDTYKKMREAFTANDISHYTYKLKSERAYRVLLRGLHSSENTETISNELRERGHEPRQVINVLQKKTKEPLPLFFVDLEPNANNIDIFKIKTLNCTKVTFEAPFIQKEILQFKRCQRFGHTKNQCSRPFRCVKCGGDHPTTTCTKSREIEATCANCQEKHPASYKGCVQYKQYRDKILNLKSKSALQKNAN